MSLNKQPELTVVVVSDYEASEQKTWGDEIAMAKALAAQDIAEPFRVIIAENETSRASPPPPELINVLPDAEIVYHPSGASAVLKDHAVSLCETPWVAVFEADALPEPDWLRLVTEAARENPDYDIINGRTYYGEETSWRRALNLLDRSFDDRGRSGESGHVSNNAALYRTETLKKFPYPPAATPFLSSRLRLEQMKAAGLKFYFRRDALTRHAIGGVSFVNDVRRNAGFSDMKMLHDPQAARIPGLAARRMKSEAGSALRVGGQYLKWLDWPLWSAIYFYARIPELRGMLEALRNVDELEGSAYR